MSRHEFMLPDVGEGLSEGEIVRWLVAVGELVVADQIVVEVQTDKAIVEIPAPVSGVLVEQGGQPNEILPIGALLAAFETDPGSVAKGQGAKGQGAMGQGAMGQGAPEGGAAAVPAPAPAPAPVAATVAPLAVAAEPMPASVEAVGRRRARASPATRKLARSLDIDLSTLSGTGSRGQITSDDVRRAAQSPASDAPPAPAADGPALASSPPPGTSPTAPSRAAPPAPAGEDRVEPLSGLRRQIALTMDEAWRTVPHIFSMDEVNASGLVAARATLNDELAPEGIKLSFLPFFIRACALSLRAHPRFNASIDMDAGTITHHARVNIGIATQTDAGLIVTVVRDADQMGLVDIARRVEELAELARLRRVTVADLAGATFSISNFGSYGGHMGTPIVRPPECAIAGFGRVRDAVIPIKGKPKVRPILPYCVSADHRLNDGADLGAFSATMIRYLTDPVRLLAVS